jgi:calcium-translocating P-type ATPase
MPTDLVLQALGTSTSGLDAPEAVRRLAVYGQNRLPDPLRPPLFFRLAGNFTHLMALLLWVGGLIAFVAGLPQLGIAILIVNLINGLFSFWQEFKAEKATEALRTLLPTRASVLRSGIEAQVGAEELVPGDVLLLGEGDRISADARLVEATMLRVDQSTLTGESRPVRKSAEPFDADGRSPAELPSLVMAGTTVSSGRGRAVVSATGMLTQFGKVAALTVGVKDELSPLQIEMKRVSVIVSGVAVAAGFLLFVLALTLGDVSPSRGFIFALGMIVAFVPEGLLPTVTLALAMGTQRMARRNALVKRLSAVETLGSTTVICTDKTGTLTQNEMTARVAAVGSSVFQFAGVGYGPGGVSPDADPALVELLTAMALASNARLVPPVTGRDRWLVVGDPTEGALLAAAIKAGVDLEALSRRAPRVAEFPFDSSRKRMSAINRMGPEAVLSVKGAPAELLARCSRFSDGREVDEVTRSEVMAKVESLAGDGLRVLGAARRWIAPEEPTGEADSAERDLEFLGLVAMHDPPRPEVEEAVQTCKRAGIRIVMITGDHGVTAATIGRRIGVISGERTRIVNGDELDGMNEIDLARVLESEVVFARATPEHKLRVVAALQSRGDVVAVTGDGVNDAPALKKADIGVAMGVSGTDVAKEAADMILLDDNFASIVAAVEEGRAVYSNIRKFTTYILTSNTPEAVPFVAFAMSGGRIPLALDVMHVLTIDLGTDLVPALGLGAEPPEPGLMEKPPRAKTEHVIDKRLLIRAYLWLGPIQAGFVMLSFFVAFRLQGYRSITDLPSSGPEYQAATAMALAAVVFTQIGNLFAQRSETVSALRVGFGGNRMLWWGIGSELALIALIVYVPAFGSVVGTAPFPAVGWLWLLIGIPLLPLTDEVRKALTRYNSRRKS